MCKNITGALCRLKGEHPDLLCQDCFPCHQVCIESYEALFLTNNYSIFIKSKKALLTAKWEYTMYIQSRASC